MSRHHFFLLLEELGQLAGNGITDLCGLCLATDIASLDALLDDNLDGLVDGLGEFGLLEGVLEHHADGEEHSDGVDDTLAGDVGCGTYADWSVRV
jgi:hypothetical protein